MEGDPYSSYAARTALTEHDASFMEYRLLSLWDPPKISVLMAVSDPDEIWLKASFHSALAGFYPHLELCVCDNASIRPHVAEFLEDIAASDGRVKVRRLPERTSFAATHNAALSLATGEFVTVLGEGDEFAPETLFRAAETLRNAGADVVYADEDSVDISDRRSGPIFKPYWSQDLLLSEMYVGRPCVVRTELMRQLGGYTEASRGAEEHDLMLRISEKTGRVHHLPGVLYHRRILGGKPVEGTREASDASRRVVEEALRRRGDQAQLGQGLVPGSIRVVRSPPQRPTVSLIPLITMPHFADNTRAQETDGTFPFHEIIPAGVGQEMTAGTVNDASAAKAANLAAGQATGEYLLFTHDFLRASSPDYVTGLLREAQRAEAGAVGGRVLNGNGTIRFAGSFLPLNRLTGGPLESIHVDTPSDLLPVADRQFNPLAITSGCMMIRRAVFEEAQGFDQNRLPTDFYDLDLSFRLREQGLTNVYVPDVTLFSIRALYPLPAAEEIEHMWERWWPVLIKAIQYRDSPLRRPAEVPDADLLAAISL